ncbi:hypothetical protein [Crocosphaera sp. XPORK-15E]|uniref:hypothetical protein n=1 Tax=Crocosphaera sp. XPORK-15E TaxID=3110247 RepID=UPI002B20C24A|nr:hypothetical protein [Crocosphaera sp. XPORK-15E]MEA5535406.1 hypothetical protein [Crocosphaera sp. XPORK-15E]
MKFNRRFLFGWTVALLSGILTKYYQKSAVSQEIVKTNDQNIPGIEPKPLKPTIIDIYPSQDIIFNNYITPIQFKDNMVPQQWLYQTQITQGEGQKLINNVSNLNNFKTLPKEQIISNSWPDFTDAIDLKKIGNNKPEIYSIFYTVITFDQPYLLRVCHGVAGLNVKAEMWVNKTPVKHGEFIQVQKGIYSIIIEVYHGNKTKWLPWNLARLATRFTIVTKAEIEAVYQWKLSQWQQTIDMAKTNDDKLLTAVKFDSKTIRGKEKFFRVGKSIYGKWWFIDPQGKAFYHRGCTGLNAGGMGGRRANLPPLPKTTVKTWVNYLKEWGFNGMGAWTTSEFFDQDMAFTEIIETYYEGPWLMEKFPDVWHPEWAENIDEKCKNLCTPLKNNKMLLGYFLDNERGFMEVLGHNESIISYSPTYRYNGPIKPDQLELPAEPKLNPKGIGLLQFCLSQKQEIPAAQKAWEFVLTRHTSLKNLGKVWQIEIVSKENIRNLTAREEILISETYLQDQSDFVQLWVEQYYQICIEKIRKYDPNHLILGCRWGQTPGPAVLEVEKQYADVVSRNNYRGNFYELFDDFYQVVNRPILNGELSTWTDDYSLIRNPIEPPGGYDTITRQKLRGREAIDRSFSHPGLLGYTKYRWHGKGDKLWNNSPQFEIINPLRQGNYRAVSIATFWDNLPQKTHEPLQGQIFVTLLGGMVKIQTLSPAREGDKPSLKMIKNHLIIGLVCSNNTWDKIVYGDGIRGEIIESETNNNEFKLTLKIQTFPTLLTATNAEAEYTLKLIRNRTKLEGNFQGIYDKNSVKGRAIAYVHRPVPTIKC